MTLKNKFEKLILRKHIEIKIINHLYQINLKINLMNYF